MDTSSSGEDPEGVREIEILAQHIREQLGSYVEVGPALLADLGARAASSDVVIRVHIDIEDHLLFCWDEHLVVGLLRRGLVEHCADIDLVGDLAHQTGVQLVGRFEAKVPAVDVVGEREGELTVVEVLRKYIFVVDRVKGVGATSLHLVV
eukprot:CAMPEP_0170501258 /NCGR_PEP_ID=MMETSP0208-20121228/37718_1 /TAXON_ID=197538 /ORGANISM="Strombidium inclinatum, Strain S3" /LENGTH=149 /DNA_ID=CAMNT_0010779697 /DNA_START=706 /DNA_END=1155 /DNA_ORIENTATION=+